MKPRVTLHSIPGVGAKTARQLSELLGGEDAAVQALLEARLPDIAAALGSERKALRLIRAARAAAKGYNPDELLGTEDAANLLNTVLSHVATYAASRPGRIYILAHSPAPSHAAADAAKRLQERLSLASSVEQAVLESLADKLRNLDWPRNCVNARRTVIVTEDNCRDIAALSETLGSLRIVKAGSIDEILEIASQSHYDDIVVYVRNVGELPLELPTAKKPSISQIAPEAILEQVRCNKTIIEAYIDVDRSHRPLLESVAKSLGHDPAMLRDAMTRLADILRIHEAEEYGESYRRLSSILARLEKTATDVEVWANEEARRRLEKLELRLNAVELLRILDSIETGNLHIPDEIQEAIEEVLLEAEDKLARELGLNEEEARIAAGMFEASPFLPIRLRQERLGELRQLVERKKALEKLRAQQALAAAIEDSLWAIEAGYRVLLELDYLQATGRFAAEFNAREVRFSGEWLGVGIEEGREVGLVKRYGADRVDPVSYAVGCTGYRPEGTSCERIILLTGANSGGKTTLLKLIAETVLLAQSGLPAPARITHLGFFDKVYYISKPTGMLSAGALETLLKRLAEIVEEAEKKRTLVLVDELEAVTEADAAARIIASFIEQLADTNAVAVIVTHMAEEIVKLVDASTRAAIRIDGIEARGLDENYNLIVDRTPRYNYLARSTPELVVKKLLRRSRKRHEKKLYTKILEKMSAQH